MSVFFLQNGYLHFYSYTHIFLYLKLQDWINYTFCFIRITSDILCLGTGKETFGATGNSEEYLYNFKQFYY